jgi:putative hydrolase of the HAD superfamily
MIRGVIFDLGSTLIEFKGEWEGVMAQGLAALLQALRATGLTLDEAAFRIRFREAMAEADRARHEDMRERTTASTLRKLLEALGIQQVDDLALESAVERMFVLSEAWWQPMPGVREVVETLRGRGYRLGMISNAADAANARRLIRKVGVEGDFRPILISAEVGWRKPHAETFLRVLREWSLPGQEVVMVGDTLHEDILGAKRAGLHQIWLRSDGQLQEPVQAESDIAPSAVADSLSQIPALIDALDARVTAG